MSRCTQALQSPRPAWRRRPDPSPPEAAIRSSAGLVRPPFFPTDYPSPSLTGWAVPAGVYSRTGLFFRATDASALLTGGVRLASKTKSPCNCSPVETPFRGREACARALAVGFDANGSDCIHPRGRCQQRSSKKCRVKGVGTFWRRVHGARYLVPFWLRARGLLH